MSDARPPMAGSEAPTSPSPTLSIIQAGAFVGAAMGPFGFGILAEQVSIPAAWRVASVIALAGASLMLVAGGWMRRRIAADGFRMSVDRARA